MFGSAPVSAATFLSDSSYDTGTSNASGAGSSGTKASVFSDTPHSWHFSMRLSVESRGVPARGVASNGSGKALAKATSTGEHAQTSALARLKAPWEVWPIGGCGNDFM